MGPMLKISFQLEFTKLKCFAYEKAMKLTSTQVSEF